MKKILIILALLSISFAASGQAIHNQGVQIVGLQPAVTNDSLYLALDDAGNTSTVTRSELKDRILNQPFDVTAAYITLLGHNHNKGMITAGSIHLNAVGLPVGYEVRFLNISALSIPITLEAGQSVSLGQSIKSLESGYYAYAEVVAAGTWSVIIPPISAAAPPGSIGGTIGAQYEIAYGSAVAGELVTSSNFTYSGLDLSVGGSINLGGTVITESTYGNWEGFRIFGTGAVERADFVSTTLDLKAVTPVTTNGVHTSILSHQGDLVLGVMEGGREVKLADDPITDWGLGNLGFNDARYLQAADLSDYSRLSQQNTFVAYNRFDAGIEVNNPPLSSSFVAAGLFWNDAPTSQTGVLIGGTYAGNSLSAVRLMNTSYAVGAGSRLGFGHNNSRNANLASIRDEIVSASYDAGVITGTTKLILAVADNSATPNVDALTIDKDGIETTNANIATLNLSGIPTYADEAAAVTGGLATGDVYKTATGELRIKL